MKLHTLLTTLLVPGFALGTPVQSAAPGSELEAGLAAGAVDRLMRRGCTSNNCARAVTGTNPGQPPLTVRQSDCSSFMRKTLVFTSTTTVAPHNERRQQTVIPSVIPAYASACDNTSKYSSACSCWGITAASTTVTTVATATATITSYTGILQVKNGDTVLGYVASDPNYWTPLVSADANSALRISFEAPAASTSVSSVAFTQLNDNRGTYFGLVVGRDNANSDIAPGSFKRLIWVQLSLFGSRVSSRHYLLLMKTEAPPGSTPQSTPSYFSTSTGLDKQAETSVWNVDIVTGAVTAQWINTDGSASATQLFMQSNHIYGGGDASAFFARYPAPVSAVSLTFIPV
ncbi:hypothetical protein CONLIGDRAFT_668434 [Coniochaeta ligniaria NRRL 30616]|uniref:Concanavalin A-like lectin/glucanase n=1 Tax=Coniochaeta ligniaria NRRL 30616 TaxID=1408157 RepID=A0A1J7JM72_9PEZI|nr:hypothetical protein CONLIGDRAFT_668434 [Coniochaeta ligniaria NRRL 30616]